MILIRGRSEKIRSRFSEGIERVANYDKMFHGGPGVLENVTFTVIQQFCKLHVIIDI